MERHTELIATKVSKTNKCEVKRFADAARVKPGTLLRWIVEDWLKSNGKKRRTA